MKPKFQIVYDGTHNLFGVAIYKAKPGETIPHEGAVLPFNTCVTGFLFSDFDLAIEISERMNRSIKTALKKARAK